MKINNRQHRMTQELAQLLSAWAQMGEHPKDAFVVLLRSALSYKVACKDGEKDWAEVLQDEKELRDVAKQMGIVADPPTSKEVN